jgi:hypothetical protein
MTIQQLKEALDRAGVRDRAYDFDGSTKDEAYSLDKVQGGWLFYYRERGIRREERLFPSEDEACRFVLDLVTRDPTTRI